MRPLLSVVLLMAIAGCRDDGGGADGMGDDASAEADAGSEGSGDESGAAASGEDSGGGTGGTAGDESGETGAGGIEGPIEGHLCPEDSLLSADNFGMPFLLTWCAGCHSAALDADERAGAPVGIDLDSIEGAREHLQRIYVRTAMDDATMPPAGGPTADERARLGDWLACGAPE